jgi:predicted ATPase
VIRNFKIGNFKSIVTASLPMARFTVLIGENGAGKSNILEALVMASAASKGNLDREVLIGRGVRVPTPDLMRSAFASGKTAMPIELSLSYETSSEEQSVVKFVIEHNGEPYANWQVVVPEGHVDLYISEMRATLAKCDGRSREGWSQF